MFDSLIGSRNFLIKLVTPCTSFRRFSIVSIWLYAQPGPSPCASAGVVASRTVSLTI
jgi:hypothetical protein